MSLGLVAFESVSMEVHVAPPSRDTSITTEARGLPPACTVAVAPMGTGARAVAAAGAARETLGAGAGVGVGVGPAPPTSALPPASMACVQMVFADWPGSAS